MRKPDSMMKLVVLDDDSKVCKLIERVAAPLNTAVESIVQVDHSLEIETLVGADLILLDLGMPGLDGIEVLRRLAQRSCPATISLISGAAHGVLESAARLGTELDLHMGETFRKPMDLDQLSALIQTVASSKEPHSGPTAEDLRQAIELGQIVPHFQPKVDLYSGSLYGVEALARWDSPSHGQVSPGVFIPLAEEYGLMKALTESISRGALHGLSKLQELSPEAVLSLNLSPSLLTELRYPDLLHEWALEAGVDPDKVTIEITESEAMREPKRYMDILIRFRIKGFHLSVDDFGTGFSSLDHLYRLPFEEIKIDKTYVADIGTNEDAAVIVKAMIGLANDLGMSTVAEGIEDEVTAKMLVDFGCIQGQGFYYSRAVCLQDLLNMCSESRGPKSQINTRAYIRIED